MINFQLTFITAIFKRIYYHKYDSLCLCLPFFSGRTKLITAVHWTRPNHKFSVSPLSGLLTLFLHEGTYIRSARHERNKTVGHLLGVTSYQNVSFFVSVKVFQCVTSMGEVTVSLIFDLFVRGRRWRRSERTRHPLTQYAV